MTETTESIPAEKQRRGRRQLLLIAGIAFFPLLAANVLFFFFPELAPEGTTNQGVLIQPAVNAVEVGVDPETGAGGWTLVIAAPEGCEQTCMDTIYLARQVNIALGKDSDRVHRLLVLPATPGAEQQTLFTEEYREMNLVVDSSGNILGAMERLLEPPLAGTIFLMDPLGNLMLAWTSDQEGKALLKDLKHLLKISGIG